MSTPPGDKERQDVAYWAQRISKLQVSRVPTGALNLNIEGREVVGPLQGFGQLWQKTYRLSLPADSMTPVEVMQVWKKNFPTFMPPKQRFYPVMDSLEPGQIILINASFTGMPVFTGVMVLYADDEAFTLMTPQGHPESGWNTFSTFSENGCTVCQIQSLARANDPIYELGFRLLGTSIQESIWIHVLEALAKYLEVSGQLPSTISPESESSRQPAGEADKSGVGEMTYKVEVSKICLDPHVQWSEARNVWQNAAMRTAFYTIGAPVRWFRRRFAKRRK